MDNVVHAPAGWRSDFENESGSAGTAAVGQFIRITDKRDIRLNPIFIIRIQIDGERRRINAAFSAVGLDIISKKAGNLVGNFLMNPARRCHIMKLPVDQLCTLAVGQIPVIF